MNIVLGIDVGTTETKCCAISNGIVIYENRVATAINYYDNELYLFNPSSVWYAIKNLIHTASDSFQSFQKITISIVCQAPTLCAWETIDKSIGISYLAFLGDVSNDTKIDRQNRAIKRIDTLIKALNDDINNYYFSGLTGYIVFQLTGILTMDTVTAWEIGIENYNDEAFYRGKYAFFRPEICSPVKQFAVKNKKLPQLDNILAGTTDSAVLPLSVYPYFHDYYIYLGTWGSLLQSQIISRETYKKEYLSGRLHDWIISIPNMISKYKENPLVLDAFFGKVKTHLQHGKRMAICGGIVNAENEKIMKLVERYFKDLTIDICPHINTAFAAANLGHMVSGEIINE